MKRIAGLLVAFALFATGACAGTHGATPSAGQLAFEFQTTTVATTAVQGDVVANINGTTPGYTYTLTNTAGGMFSLTGSHVFVGATALTAGAKTVQVTGTASGQTPEVASLSITVAAPTVTSVGAALDRTKLTNDFNGNFASGLTFHSPWQAGDQFQSYYGFGWYANYTGRALPPGDLGIAVDPTYLGLGLTPYSTSDGILTAGVYNTPVADLGAIGGGVSPVYPFQYYGLLLTTASSFSFTYGCAEVREQPMSGNGALNGVWPSFYEYLLSGPGSPAEFDVFEYFGTDGHVSPDSFDSTVHCSSVLCPSATTVTPAGHALGYHDYTFCRNTTDEWWYYDGVMIKHTTLGDATMGTNGSSLFYMIVPLSSTTTGTSFAGNYSPITSPPSTLSSQLQYVRHYTFTGSPP